MTRSPSFRANSNRPAGPSEAVGADHVDQSGHVLEMPCMRPDGQYFKGFWLAAGTDRLILEEPDEMKRAALLLSALLGETLDVELAVKIPLPRKRGAVVPLRATIVSAIDIRAIAAGLAERFHPQLKIFE